MVSEVRGRSIAGACGRDEGGASGLGAHLIWQRSREHRCIPAQGKTNIEQVRRARARARARAGRGRGLQWATVHGVWKVRVRHRNWSAIITQVNQRWNRFRCLRQDTQASLKPSLRQLKAITEGLTTLQQCAT
eukprot:9247585-Pyramimonas_sp.AAC.1